MSVRLNINRISNPLQVDGPITAPDFYGDVQVLFKETELGGFQDRSNKLAFDSEFFYLQSGGDGGTIVSRNVEAGAGEANTASNKGGDEGIFFQKTDVDLEFKGLTAGSNITLSSDDDAITIASTGGGGAASFYKTVSITVEDPCKDEDITIFRTPVAITIQSITGVIRGSANPTVGPSVTVNPRHDLDRSAEGATVLALPFYLTSQSGEDLFYFHDRTIPAESWLWLETPGKTGTVKEVNLTFDYTED